MGKLYLVFLVSVLGQPVFAQSTSEALVFGKKVEKRLNADERHCYKILMDKNSCLELTMNETSVDLAVDIVDAQSKTIKTISTYYSCGSEIIEFTSPTKGIYSFEVYPAIETDGISDSLINEQKIRNQGVYEISKAVGYTAKECLQSVDNINKTIDWIKQNALPLKSVTAGSGFEDITSLKDILKDVKIVGLGEATHGTKEFFQMKHRMLEFLVKEMGYTVFAMEASYAGCENINDYVLRGKGNARDALESQGLFCWNTQEVLDIVEWVRSYNSGVFEDKKVKFLGYDIQQNTYGGSFPVIHNYLKRVDSRSAEQNYSLLKMVEKIDSWKSVGIKIDSCTSEYFKFMAQFIMNKGDYVQRSSNTDYDGVLQRIKVIGQVLSLRGIKGVNARNESVRLRDYYMASNFMDIVQRENPNTKFVVWAHNGHISKMEPYAGNEYKQMFGNYLNEAYGDKYFAFGFSFSKGCFQAKEFSSEDGSYGINEFKVPDAKENSLDWYLLQTGLPQFIIPYRSKTLPSYVNDFFQKKFDARNIGAITGKSFVNYVTLSIVPSHCYDAIIFIDNTTRATPITVL